MSRKRMDISIDDLVKKYRSGWSVKRLAEHYSIGRTGIVNRLHEVGITQRSKSESMYLRHAQLGPEGRRKLSEAAHAAVRGTHWPIQAFIKRALTIEKSPVNQSPQEILLYKHLEKRNLLVTPQKAIGIYNCDFAMHPVTVEIFGGGWHFVKKRLANFCKRTRYILNRGWHVLVIHVTVENPITPSTANYVTRYIEEARRNPAATCEYRMIRCTGETISCGSAKDKHVAFKFPNNRSKHLLSKDPRFTN